MAAAAGLLCVYGLALCVCVCAIGAHPGGSNACPVFCLCCDLHLAQDCICLLMLPLRCFDCFIFS